MARDHARLRLDIWADDDWRNLSSGAQWLYMFILGSASLSFAGVADWRPARISGFTADLSGDDVELYASELEAGLFLVVDRETEEVLVRSFVKHDGLLKQPNMARALVKAHANIGSRVLRAVVVHELKRLQVSQPDLHWDVLEDVLEKASMSPGEGIDTLPQNPSVDPSPNPSGKGSDDPFGSGRPSLRVAPR